ncbi:GNAT family N-acetyltransferase [Roseomonas sp. BN140053]|uniref:GNAT family N-acetyltransferase n=1 Tax=Roseomonas sp. BN140053 TaxID=3391898 RepID=UPI0039E7F0FA
MTPMVLEGARLRLRLWRAEDRVPFLALNAEPAVQRYLRPMSREVLDAMLDRVEAGFAERGWGFWAVEHRAEGRLIGMCGLMPVIFEAFFTPAVEIGWRLASRWHGQGLAREAATLCLDAAFGPLELDRVVAFTVPANTASWGLMRRLGMREIGGFDHPRLPEGDALRRHVAYAITAVEWRAGRDPADRRG